VRSPRSYSDRRGAGGGNRRHWKPLRPYWRADQQPQQGQLVRPVRHMPRTKEHASTKPQSVPAEGSGFGSFSRHTANRRGGRSACITESRRSKGGSLWISAEPAAIRPAEAFRLAVMLDECKRLACHVWRREAGIADTADRWRPAACVPTSGNQGREIPVSRNRAQVVAFTIAASLRTRRKRKSIRAQAYRSGVWVPICALAVFAARSRIATCITSSLQRAPALSSRCQEFC
jgi:hypothetical protein